MGMMDREKALEAQLTAATVGRQRIDILNELAWELRARDPQRVLALGEEARTLASQGELYQEGLAYGLRALSAANSRLGNYGLSASQALEAMPLFEELGLFSDQATMLIIIGLAFAHLADYSEGLKYLLQSLQLARRIGDKEREASALVNIGFVYGSLGDYTQELATYREVLGIYQEIGDLGIAECAVHNNLAMAYCALRDLDDALAHGQKALQLTRDLGDRITEAATLNTIGDVYLEMADYDQAQTHYQEGISLARRIRSKVLELDSLLNIGYTYHQQRQPNLSLSYLRQGLALAEEIGARSQAAKCHQFLSQVHKDQGRLEDALHHLEQCHSIEKEVFSQEAEGRIRNLLVIHQTETARREAEIHRLRNVELEKEITERVRAEAALRELNATLEKTVLEKTAALDELDAFAHTVAHDLKNPLARIVGFAEVLEKDYASLPDEGLRRYLHMMAQNGRKMSNIVDELLLMATVRKMEEVEMRSVDMTDIVAEAQARLADSIEERRAEIVIPEKWPTALGYAPWVEEVWVNYLSNGLKYGGRPPRLECGATPHDDGMIRFWVRDNGDGLTPEAQASLFIEFTRIGDVRVEGHGLGLSIVQRIIEKLGGQVGVESEIGKGSVFYFTLPGV